MKKLIALLLLLFLTGCQSGETLGGNYDQTSTWYVYNQFSGYETKLDPSKIGDGANPQGQNTSVFEGDRIGVRKLGYTLFPEGEASTSEEAITTLHTFRKRNGENILMRSYSTFLEYFEEANDTWTTLKTGLSDGAKFGYSDYNINTDLHSYVYFGNGVDDAMRWSGDHTTLTQAVEVGTTTIHTTLNDGFSNSGTLIFCGTQIAFSARTATTFTISAATVDCDSGKGVAEAVTTYAAHPKGNIYLNANNRLFIAGITATPQAVYFSKYGDATDFVGASLVLSTTATAPGIFNLGEGGGSVTGMVLEENSIYIFKKSIIYKATLTDTIYTLLPLKPFDSRSQTTGATHSLAVFSGNNQIFFTTPDNEILSLERIENVDYPQTIPISDTIKPTTDVMNFEESTGIVFQDKAYFSQKINNNSNSNDVVLAWNIQGGFWDSPLVGWNASDFTIYDDGTGNALYFGSSNSTNVYKVTNTPTDDIYEVVANWRSKQFDFGTPQAQKEINDFYVEGYITPNTSLKISLLLDEDGYTQIISSDVLGSESQYIYNSEDYNSFGLSAFGTKRFGSNAENESKEKFRIYFSKGLRLSPFYNVQVEFASDGDNMDWEITNYGFLVRPYSQPQKRELIRELK